MDTAKRQTLEEKTRPMFPDDIKVHRYTCWNCGKNAKRFIVPGSANRFMCECGCGWSVRWDVPGLAVETAQREFREAALARQYGTELVDFTSPDALPAPA